MAFWGAIHGYLCFLVTPRGENPAQRNQPSAMAAANFVCGRAM